MLIAGVVDNKIHNNADVPLFCFCNEGIHILQRTIIGVDIAVIADIIAVILIGRRINRRKPQGADTELLQIIQTGNDTR